jgi:hypothetical protein
MGAEQGCLHLELVCQVQGGSGLDFIDLKIGVIILIYQNLSLELKKKKRDEKIKPSTKILAVT